MNIPSKTGRIFAALTFVMVSAQAQQQPAREAVAYPPVLPGGKEVATDKTGEFLKPPQTLRPDVTIATTPPAIDFLFYPGQTYPGNPWSNWGDSLAVNGKYYASIGDHHSLEKAGDSERSGNAFVFEYDPQTRKMRPIVDVKKLLNLPKGHYTPGKIHGRIDLGSDGWLYFATYRGGNSTTDEYHYQGDWILRVHPDTGQAEAVARGPVPKQGLQTSILDSQRLIFYAGTRAGKVNPRGTDRGAEDELFMAYDLREKRLLHSGPKRSCWPWPIFARSTGRVYYVQGRGEEAAIVRYDPEKGGLPVKIDGPPGFEGASTEETPQGFIYTASMNRETRQEALWSFDTKSEKIQELGPARVAETPRIIATLDADPSGRYLYYTPGAHGGSELDGTPIVQFDVRTRRKKVIAFLHPFYKDNYGCTFRGTYSCAVDPSGDKLYVTWNVSRGSKVWDSCALTVIHIPESERR
ncbi:MAG: hypothetical protein M3463_06180 [Verrucomicrobiota bacterium]|nr:hypothetical protein [Verrucomicrobiota bacterium]